MSAVLKFLEAMGRTSSTAAMSDGEYAATVARLDIDAAQQRALLDRDHAALNDLLGGRATMFFGLVPAENDEPQRDDGEGEGEAPEQSPDTDRAD